MTKPQDLLALAQAAIRYAQAVAHTQHCKELLRSGYSAWRDAHRPPAHRPCAG